ncbi:MAG: UDP-N-acetylmuramoyl-L-alanine--D-glutamate ligase [Verrucomicrobia bacterium]|nr:UDP-N-acetylmuramoyl-L-alanine--D-glutamate ligase [Verrucomicrobiota bacterium]
MREWRDRQVLVVGLGVSGEAAARFLVEQGARVAATDAGASDRLRALKTELERLGARVEIGGHTASCLDGIGLVVLSPGVPPSALPVRLADERGVPVISEIELAYRQCAARIAAITGTNGKTTVTRLVERLLTAGGIGSITAGNIGDPLIEQARAVGPNGVLAIELSSFQLERIERFRPQVGVLLNVTPDHMDRYATLDDYARAKMRLFENQTPDDTAVVHESVIALGYRPEGMRVVVYGDGPECDLRLDGETVVSRPTGRRYELRGLWHLPGRFNTHNAMGALAVAEAFGVGREPILEALGAFRGLPHRLELVAEQCGVRYVNDSKGTNVDAVEKALDAIQAPVVLIAGGLDKDLDFESLRPKVRAWVKKLVLIGTAAPKLARTFADSTDCVLAGSLDEAVEIARRSARPGDTVLLSPGCASFDMFRDYADRGNQFKACVRTKAACTKAAET